MREAVGFATFLALPSYPTVFFSSCPNPSDRSLILPNTHRGTPVGYSWPPATSSRTQSRSIRDGQAQENEAMI